MYVYAWCSLYLVRRTLFYCIVYRNLYSASNSVSQTEALSVHFSSMRKAHVRLKARERQGKRSRGTKRREALPERRANSCKGLEPYIMKSILAPSQCRPLNRVSLSRCTINQHCLLEIWIILPFMNPACESQLKQSG